MQHSDFVGNGVDAQEFLDWLEGWSKETHKFRIIHVIEKPREKWTQAVGERSAMFG